MKKTVSFLLAVLLLIPPFAPWAVHAEEGSVANSGSLVNAVSGHGGSLDINQAIKAPPGRNGLQPELTLSYDINAGSDHDLFGYGWSIDIPHIQRLNKYGSDQLYTGTSSFFSSLSGELVQIGSSNDYRAKIETGDFVSYTLDNDIWTATDKSGRVYTFGSTTASRQDNAASSSQIYKWMVNDIRDPNDNYIKFTYHKNQNQIYPDIITYTGHGATDGIFEVHFEREAKAADHNSYFPAFEVTTASRIDRIEIQINDSWTRRYDLAYTTGDNTSRDILDTITESARTEDGVLTETLPAAEYAYQATTRKTAVTPHTNFSNSIPGFFWDDNQTIYDQGYRLAHINSDGLIDLVHADGGDKSQGKIYYNDGDEWNLSSSTFNGLVNFDDLDFRFGAVRMLDVNGDQITDVVGSYLPNGGTALEHVYFGDGDGTWTYSSSYSNSIPEHFIEVTDNNNFVDNGYQFAEVNGDGLIDLVHDAIDTSSTNHREVYINDGTKWVEDTSMGTPSATELAFIERIARLVDVNGDGLDDIVHSAEQQAIWKKVYLNNGSGSWTEDSDWSSSISDHFVEPGEAQPDLGYRLIDINNDDLPDIVHKDEIALNTGDGWNATTTWQFPSDNSFDLTDETSFLVDADGDGLIDLVRSEKEGSLGFDDVFLNEGVQADLLASTTNPQGGVTTFTYQGSAELGDTSGNRNNPDLPFVVPVVTNVTYDNAFSTTWSESHDYEGGDYYFSSSDIRDRKFAGFAKRTTTNDLATTHRYFHQGNDNHATSSESGDSEARIGLNYRTEIEDLDDDLYQAVINNFADTDLGDDATFVARDERITANYDGDGDYKASAIGFAFSTSTGNLETQTEYGEGTISGATFTDTGSDKRTTEYTYATGASSDVIGAVSEEHVKDNGSSTVRRTKHYYDSLAHGSVSDGNRTKAENWIEGSTYVDTNWTYNSFGLPSAQIDPRNNTTTFAYDSDNLYVSTTTQPESLETVTVYDYSSGQLVRTTPPNGAFTETDYDPLDRQLAERIPDPSTGTNVKKNTFTYTDTKGAAAILTDKKRDASNGQVTHTYLDGFGRPIQERARAEDTNQYVVRDYKYGANGLLDEESLPYFDSGSARSAATSDNELYTEYGFDARERIVAATSTAGATLTAYDQWTETVTDPLGNSKIYEYDAHGRLIKVTEKEGASDYETDYEFDDNDNLTKVTDDANNERNITYDGLSRRTKLEDLHDPADSTFGSTTFSYDAASNLTSRTSPNGDVTNWTYDDVNRPLTENFTGAAGTEVSYTYDNCTNGEGLVCTVANQAATTTYTYTANGLVASETKTIAGTAYTTEWEFDRQGNETLITYPDDSEVRYTYNEFNEIEQVEQRENGGSWQDIIANFDYGPHGQITEQVFGNGATTTRTYDADELYRLRSIVTQATTTGGVGGAGEEHAQIEAELTAMLAEAEEVPEPGPELAAETPAEPADQPSEEPAADTTPNEEEATSTPITAGEEQEEIASSTPITAETAIITTASSSEPESLLDPIGSTELSTPAVLETTKKSEGNSDKPKAKDTGRYEETSGNFELALASQGKVKASKSEPKVRLQTDNGQVDLEVSYDDVTAPGEYDPKADKLKWKGSAQELHAYELAPAPGMEEGGFEIEIQLNEKPDTNEFEFALEGYKNLKFDYQPPLDDEPLAGETCTATECVDELGDVTRHRPENVVDSYAVYHTDKTHGDGESAKVFHIFRPKITDADGNAVWGELEIDKDDLLVTVPTEFLETATYPVLVDPTFGYTTAGASSQTFREDFRGALFTSPSDYSSFTSMHFYCRASTATSDTKGMIVEHSSLNLVTNGVSDAETCTTTGAWKTLTFSSTPSLSASTEYLLGGIGADSRTLIYYDSGDTDQGHYDSTNSYSSPSNLGSISHNDNKYSVYITYTASGGGGNATPTAPTLLETEGQTNPTDITDNTPEFTAIYNDPDSGDKAIYYEIEVDDDSGFGSKIWDSGKTALATTTAGNRTADISYAGSALASSTTYYWRVKFWDDEDAEGEWSTSTATFSLAAAPPANASPTAPTLLETEGQTNPTAITDNTPEFTAIYNDPNSGDLAVNYQLQVATSTSFTTNVWDSTKTALATTTAGNRTGDITYAGSALASSTTYYWRIKLWDDSDAEGLWSTTTSSFVLASNSSPEPPSGGSLIQSLHYVYDLVGNITKIVDRSQTQTAATTTYTYDDLYRLLSASTTQASSSPYSDTYTYSSIGNITNFDGTSYTYAETGYANPHAVTTVGSDTYTYDENGNLTSDGTATNTWDYNNRLSSTAIGSTTITYGYDHDGQRVSKTVVEETAGGGGDGSISFVGAGTIADASSLQGTTGQTVSLPGGVQDDDFLILFSHRNDDSGDFNTPSGWTRQTAIDGAEAVGADRTTGIFTRVADSEPANYTLTHTDTGNEQWASVIVAYRGVDTSTPLDVTPSASHYTAERNDASPPNNAITTATDDAWTLVLAGITHDDITSGVPPSGYTERVDHTGAAIDHRQLQVADKEIASSGTESPGDWQNTVTSNSAEYNVATMALRPDSSGEGGGGSTATTTTLYVSGLYETENGSSTKHVYAGDLLVATIEGSGAGALTYFAHLDHLGSTNVMTDGIGETEELLAYYPYGADRIDQSGDIDQTKRFTGHDFDAETDLTYMKARYYGGETGRFTSQDPVALALGDAGAIENKVQGSFEQFLKHPQMMNSYAYALNNPVKLTDPVGEAPPLLIVLGYAFAAAGIIEVGTDLYNLDLVHRQYPDAFTDADRKAAQQRASVNLLTTGLGLVLPGPEAIVFDGALLTADVMGHAIESAPFDGPLDYQTTPAVLPSQVEPQLESKPLLPQEVEIREREEDV